MRRRTFTQLLPASLAVTASFFQKNSPKKRRLLPKRLRPGDTVGLITPGSFINDEKLQKAVTNLEALGFKVKPGKHLRAQYGFVAGSDEQRLSDLHAMFADPQVQAVWCARGGYGCTRLLPQVDYKLIRKNPKVLVGFSDITALLIAVQQQSGLVGFHGPVASSEMTDYTKAQLQSVLLEHKAKQSIPIAKGHRERGETDTEYDSYSIREGRAEGCLTGGNLSLLAAMAGTPFQPDVRKKLVFIEEIGEAPYRVDRMLTQLRQAYPLREAAGILLGVFAGCERKPNSLSLTLRETLIGRLADLGIPVFYGVSIGHVEDNATLPVGIRARLDAGTGQLTLLETGVS